MTFVCQSCGEVHEGLPHFFRFVRPASCTRFWPWNRHKFKQVNDYACHYADKRHYIRGELLLPLTGDDEGLAFVLWIQVSRQNFERYLEFRANEGDEPDPPAQLPGYLGNLIPGFPDELGTRVWFAAEKGDMLPNVTLVDPDLKLGKAMRDGVSGEYWHELATWIGGGHGH